MRITSSHLGNIVLTCLLFFCLLLWARESFALEADDQTNDGKVEVVYAAEALAPYKERRSSSALVFALSRDGLDLEKFRSKIDGAAYRDLFGTSPVPLVQASFGGKYNFPLGGIEASALYGYGWITDGRSGEDTTLTLQKMGAQLTYVMDNLFREPYVAPYLSGQFFAFKWEEVAKNTSTQERRTESGTTAFTAALQAGLLLQLNWLDADTALAAQNTTGLQNTYLDVFVSQYNSSNGSADPNFQTDLNYGFGMKLEY